MLHGAGVSHASGLPLFSSLNKKERTLLDYDLDRRSVASQHLFRNLWAASLMAKPTHYHLLLQLLHQHQKLKNVLSFNVDHLEFLAAKLPAEKVQQLHGSTHQLHCGNCHMTFDTAQKWVEGLEEGKEFIHDCNISARRPRKVQQSLRNLHFHVRMYGSDPCADMFPSKIKVDCPEEKAPVLIIAGCSLRTSEQKQLSTQLVKQIHGVGGNVIYINPETPPRSILKAWGPTVLYLSTTAEYFAQSTLTHLSTSSTFMAKGSNEAEWAYIAKSTIAGAGQGLFANRFIPANTRIMHYTGETIDHAELIRRYGDRLAPYAIRVHHDLYIDANDATQSNIARYINTLFAEDNGVCNVIFEGEMDDRIAVRTLTDIKMGEELFADYGDEYCLPSADAEQNH